jgi:hypothetical protein
LLALIRFIGASVVKGERAKEFTRATASGGAGNKRTVLTRRGFGRAHEMIVVQSESAPKRRDDDVMSEVLGLVAHASVPT